ADRSSSSLRAGLRGLQGGLLRVRRVDPDPRPHRGGQGDRLDVPALRRRRLRPQQLLDHRQVVLQEALLVERSLPDHQVDVPLPVDAVLELPGLDVAHGLADVERHGAGLRVRHQAAGAQHPPRLPDHRHHVRGGHRRVEVDGALHDLVDQVLGADHVGAGLPGLASLVAGGERRHPDGPPRAVRERDGPPDHLVRLPGVDAQAHGGLDRLVEPRRGQFPEQPDGLRRAVSAVAVDLGGCSRVALAARAAHAPTSTPMLRAVPSMIRMAASTSTAFRSTIFRSAIWRTWSFLSFATFMRFGSPEPFSRPAACLISSAAGGCLVTNEKLRSSKIVSSTGMTWPAWAWVASLYCRQNSMMFTPCWPSAVPTGGAGVAWPALIWSLTSARTFLRLRGAGSAMFLHLLRFERPPPRGLPPWVGLLSTLRFGGVPASGLGHLIEGELDRGLPIEDVDEHLQLGLLDVDLGDRAGEAGERPRGDLDHVALLPFQAVLGLLLRLLLHRQDLLHLPGRERGGLRTGPAGDEPRHAGRVAHDVPGVVVVDHAHQQVAGEDLALDDLLLPALVLHDVLHGDHDVEDLVLHLHRGDALV